MKRLTGVEFRRIHVDKGYRGRKNPNKFRVRTWGQLPRVTRTIPRGMKRRCALAPAAASPMGLRACAKRRLCATEPDDGDPSLIVPTPWMSGAGSLSADWGDAASTATALPPEFSWRHFRADCKDAQSSSNWRL
jgi:hypothetical protein